MANQIGVNTVSIAGKIIKPRYYPDRSKWVFTLVATSGRYYVEYSQSDAQSSIVASENQVIITGSLFSRRTRDGCDSGSICARDIMLVAQAA